MAKIEDAIYSRMSAYAALMALVSTRIYPGSIPQEITADKLPAIAYQKPEDRPGLAHSGATGSHRCLIQFSIAADDYDTKKAIADAVRSCWHGYVGTIGAVTIELAKVDDRNDIDEAQVENALGERVDVQLWYRL